METFLIKATQLILALAFLVVIHEFGHFLFARIFGIRVEKFYIFFDPWIEIFKWKPGKYHGFFGKTSKKDADAEKTEAEIGEGDAPGEKKRFPFWKDTEYGIGWLPLGGYCKISGMIDESMDTDQMKCDPKPWEFRSKPAWQRFLVMIAGVLFNFLLAILIYAGIVYATGEQYVPFANASDGMMYSPEAQKIGFRDGDIPLSADGKPLDNPAEGRMEMLQAASVNVLRGKDTVTVRIPENFIFRINEEASSPDNMFSFLTYRIPAQVSQVMAGEGAAKAGIKEGDRIIAVSSRPTPDLPTFMKSLENHANRSVPVTLLRGNDTIRTDVRLSDNSKMGIGLEIDPTAFYPAVTKSYNLFESVPRGVELGVNKLTSYARSLKLVFTKEGAKSIGGFGALGSIFPEKWDWLAFWNIAAFLSVMLALMNILPIPALDGGHALFLLFEVMTGKKPSDKFMERAQIAGMAFLILLLLYANGMDIIRLFK